MTDSSQPDGMTLPGYVADEAGLQAWLHDYFEQHGWTAIREASPHGRDVRADLIVSHDDYGWFGIETKYCSGDGGATFADAHHQITRQYRGHRYLGNRITRWCICPYFEFASRDYKGNQIGHRIQFAREFFCRHGVGYVHLGRSELVMDFSYSNKEQKIPVDDAAMTRYADTVDLDVVDRSIARKREERPYV